MNRADFIKDCARRKEAPIRKRVMSQLLGEKTEEEKIKQQRSLKLQAQTKELQKKAAEQKTAIDRKTEAEITRLTNEVSANYSTKSHLFPDGFIAPRDLNSGSANIFRNAWRTVRKSSVFSRLVAKYRRYRSWTTRALLLKVGIKNSQSPSQQAAAIAQLSIGALFTLSSKLIGVTPVGKIAEFLFPHEKTVGRTRSNRDQAVLNNKNSSQDAKMAAAMRVKFAIWAKNIAYEQVTAAALVNDLDNVDRSQFKTVQDYYAHAEQLCVAMKSIGSLKTQYDIFKIYVDLIASNIEVSTQRINSRLREIYHELDDKTGRIQERKQIGSGALRKTVMNGVGKYQPIYKNNKLAKHSPAERDESQINFLIHTINKTLMSITQQNKWGVTKSWFGTPKTIPVSPKTTTGKSRKIDVPDGVHQIYSELQNTTKPIKTKIAILTKIQQLAVSKTKNHSTGRSPVTQCFYEFVRAITRRPHRESDTALYERMNKQFNYYQTSFARRRVKVEMSKIDFDSAFEPLSKCSQWPGLSNLNEPLFTDKELENLTKGLF